MKEAIKNQMNANGSQVFGVSIRAYIALMLTLTLCVAVFLTLPITEPFYTVVIMVVSFYFGTQGQTTKKQNENPTTDNTNTSTFTKP